MTEPVVALERLPALARCGSGLPILISFLNAVSCPSTSFCVAGDVSGNLLTYDGTSWSAPNSVDPGNFIDAVSCVSSSFCVAVDSGANALTTTGRRGRRLTPSIRETSSLGCRARSASFRGGDLAGRPLTHSVGSVTTSCTSGKTCTATLADPSQKGRVQAPPSRCRWQPTSFRVRTSAMRHRWPRVPTAGRASSSPTPSGSPQQEGGLRLLPAGRADTAAPRLPG